jgi:2-oxo-4-hydroxy-4-carboxy--5-ureidoimidazoline (OHCU) decarboxylase
MNANEVIKNIIGFNEHVFENTYKTLGIIWDKNQKIAEEAIEKAAFLPEEVKALNRRYLEGVKQAGENLREAVLKVNEQIKTRV